MMSTHVIPSFGDFRREKEALEDSGKVSLLARKDPRPVAVVGDLEHLKRLVAEETGVEPVVVDAKEWDEMPQTAPGQAVVIGFSDAGGPGSAQVCYEAREAWRLSESASWTGPKVFLHVPSYPSPARQLWFVPNCELSSATRRETISKRLDRAASDDLLGEARMSLQEMVTPDEAKEYLKKGIKISKSSGKPSNIVLVGESGIGKTQIVREVCKEMGMAMAYFNVPQMDEMIQLLGIPFEETVDGEEDGHVEPELERMAGGPKKARRYLAFIREKRVMEAEIILWDELSGASDARKYNAMLPVLVEKQVNGTPLEHYVCSIATMNGSEYSGVDISMLDDRLLRRFSHKIWVRPDVNVKYMVTQLGVKPETAQALVDWYHNDLDDGIRAYFSPFYLEKIGQHWDEDPDPEFSVKMIGPGRIREDHPENIPYGKLIARLTGRGVVDLEVVKKNPKIIDKEPGYSTLMVADAIEELKGDDRVLLSGEIYAKLGPEQVRRLLMNSNTMDYFIDKDQKNEKDMIKKAAKGDAGAKFWIKFLAKLREEGFIKVPPPGM